jgi:hypothetical protein
MSSLSRCVAATIAKCIAAVMKRPGGIRPVSILPKLLAPFGRRHIHCQAYPMQSGQNYEANPIWKPAFNDSGESVS